MNARDKAVEAIRAEVERRGEYYGLDNWTFGEVVDFVLEHAGFEEIAEKAARYEDLCR